MSELMEVQVDAFAMTVADATSGEAKLTPTGSMLWAEHFAAPQGADGLADALVAGQLSPRTRRAYASDLAELLSVLDLWGIGLAGVTRAHLHAYRDWLDGQDAPGLEKRPRCAPATVSRKLSVLRRFFAEALDRGMITADPATRLRGFSVSGESKTLGLDKAQARALLGSIETTTLLGLRDAAILSLMIRTGLRRMDVVGAAVENLGEQRGHKTLRVLSKGNKERLVKVPGEVAFRVEAWRAAASALREERPGTPLFCGLVKAGRGKEAVYLMYGEGQKPLSDNALWKIVAKRAKAAGIADNITPHSTRHAFITLALDGGAPLHKVQAAAGHADPRTTERYWRTKQNLDDNAVDYIHL